MYDCRFIELYDEMKFMNSGKRDTVIMVMTDPVRNLVFMSFNDNTKTAIAQNIDQYLQGHRLIEQSIIGYDTCFTGHNVHLDDRHHLLIDNSNYLLYKL